jgi:Skp family chaperone for outer membrane proteins
MKKTYIATSRFSMTFADDFYVEKGDVIVFDQANKNRLTIFSNGVLMKSTTVSNPGSVTAIVTSGWMYEPPAAPAIDQAAVAAKAAADAKEAQAKQAAIDAEKAALAKKEAEEKAAEAKKAEAEKLAAEQAAKAAADKLAAEQAAKVAAEQEAAKVAAPVEEPAPVAEDPFAEEVIPEAATSEEPASTPEEAPAAAEGEAAPDLESMPYKDLLAHAKDTHGISLAASAGRKAVIAEITKKQTPTA